MLDWTVKQPADGIVVAPDERLPWPQTVALGMQHVVAMFGATVLAPLLMGFDPNVAILMSGVGTLIFFVAVGGRVPSYVGSSFAFISVVAAATGYAGQGANANIAVALGGIVVCGAVYALVGLVVMASGTGWIERLMPPVVTGAVVAVIERDARTVRDIRFRVALEHIYLVTCLGEKARCKSTAGTTADDYEA